MVKLEKILGDILPVILSGFISLSRIGPAHYSDQRLPRTSPVLCYDLKIEWMEYAALGIRINPMPQGWMDIAQLPDAAEHGSISRAASSLCSQRSLTLQSSWAALIFRETEDRQKGWGPKLLQECSIRSGTQAPVLSGPQSLAIFPPQYLVVSSLYLVNKLFLNKMWVWILSENGAKAKPTNLP